MPQDKLVPGGRPKQDPPVPVKGDDKIFRIDRVRHRAFNGRYVRSSGSGYTAKECLADWEKAFERNRRKGSVRRSSERHKFEPTDTMSLAFEKFIEQTQKLVDKGKRTQITCDNYRRMIYQSDSPLGSDDAIRLDSEMGDLTIAEAGKPAYLADYIQDVADIVPGVAAQQHTVLKGVFKMLTLAGVFDVSPMALVPGPEESEENQRALTIEERNQLYDLFCTRITRAKYARIMCLIILGTGVRRGEALALRWCDVPDLDDEKVQKAVMRVGATVIKPTFGGAAFRQDKRKHGKKGHAYYITLPQWLTDALRDHKRASAPESEESPILVNIRGGMVEPASADDVLYRAKADTAVDWVTWGNLRDTVATHVWGRSGDRQCASAQLGHAGSAPAITNRYIDRNGYVHPVVDNSKFLEELKPVKVGAKLESAQKRRGQ